VPVATATTMPVATATTMPMAAAMPGSGRVMGAGKQQGSRHQGGCGEQLSHRSSPWPVLLCWQSRCPLAVGKPRNVAPARGGRRLATCPGGAAEHKIGAAAPPP
jgi:hypothetical protein